MIDGLGTWTTRPKAKSQGDADNRRMGCECCDGEANGCQNGDWCKSPPSLFRPKKPIMVDDSVAGQHPRDQKIDDAQTKGGGGCDEGGSPGTEGKVNLYYRKTVMRMLTWRSPRIGWLFELYRNRFCRTLYLRIFKKKYLVDRRVYLGAAQQCREESSVRVCVNVIYVCERQLNRMRRKTLAVSLLHKLCYTASSSWLRLINVLHAAAAS